MARYQQRVSGNGHQSIDQEWHPLHGMQQATSASHQLINEFQRLFAELLGTFALTMVAAEGAMMSTITPGAVSPTALYVAAGLLIMVMIYALWSTSGAHLNSTITLAFALRLDFSWRRVPG